MITEETRLKNIYSCMKQRCCNPKNTAARWYHDRGITVCDEWLRSYEAFEKWALSHGYTDEMTIDRIDPDGNYCPGNCQWITKLENLQKARKPGEATEFIERKPRVKKEADYVFTHISEEEREKINSIVNKLIEIPPIYKDYIRGIYERFARRQGIINPKRNGGEHNDRQLKRQEGKRR